MAPVVKELAALPDEDIRAMAVYLGSFNDNADRQAGRRTRWPPNSKPRPARASFRHPPPARGSIEGACAVCHEVGGAPLFGSRPSLALNSNLHSAVPDNLIQVILHGIAAPASSDLGYMPGFKDSLTDGQLAELVSYLRQQFAPDKPPWTGVQAAIGRVTAGDRALNCMPRTATPTGCAARRHDRVPPMAVTDIATRTYNHGWRLDPIVRSLLDTDFYKLLMLQMIREFYPDQHVTFSVINRSRHVRLAEVIDEGELRAQLDHARTIRFSQEGADLARR